MGAVYRATDTKLNREVAIKVLPESLAGDPDRLARFSREAQVLASLNHPNIAAIYGVEERAIVMELVEGASPAGPLRAEEALPLIEQLIDGLEYAHEKGVIHRDLKPANLKVTTDGRLKVLDFGLAKALSNDTPAGDPATSPTLTIRATQTGVIMGTAAYMSPEQARGQGVDKRADIWSFGVVVYELLTGKNLFEGETVSDTLAAVLTRDPDFTHVPPRFQRLLRLCLTRDPRQRLRDISTARLLLEKPAPVTPLEVASHGRGGWMAATAILSVVLATLSWVHFRETPPLPEVTRFQVFPPPGGAFDRPFLALSPDGRQVVFSVTGKGSTAGNLWVRALDAIEARPLAGTEGGLFPFWSPDSRSIGYWLKGGVYRVEVSGGPPRMVCNVGFLSTGGEGAGTWSTDGNIYFAAGYSGIFRVPQAGGQPVAVLRPDKSRGESSFFFPIVLPDGKGLLYQNQGSNLEDFAIEYASVDGTGRKRITGSRFSFSYAPPVNGGAPGHLLITRQHTLFAQPVNPRTFELQGEAFPVAENIIQSIRYAAVAASANGTLLYGYYPAHPKRRLKWYDRSGAAVAPLGPSGQYGAVSLSRDGSKVITLQPDPEQSLQNLWSVEVARGVPMRLSSTGDARAPVFAPDGSRLLFSLRTNAPPQLYLKDLNGSGREELLVRGEGLERGDGGDRPCDWSRDGRLLLFTRERQTGSEMRVLSGPAAPGQRASEPVLSAAGFIGHCQFSPEEGGPKWVAYTSGEFPAGFEVYVQSYPPGGGKFQISDRGGIQPRWRRDGKELYYLAPDGKLMTVDIRLRPQFQAGVPRVLFDPHPKGNRASGDFVYDAAPDGQRFLFITEEDETAGPPPGITVVTNWLAGTKR